MEVEEVVKEDEWMGSSEVESGMEELVGREWVERHEMEADGLRHAILHFLPLLLWRFGVVVVVVVLVGEVHRGCLCNAGTAKM